VVVVINQLDVVSEPPPPRSNQPARTGTADADEKKLVKLLREVARDEARRRQRLKAT